MINFGFLSLDILIFIILILVLIFTSFKIGKKFLYSMILSFYPTVLVLENLPYVELTTRTSSIVAFVFIYIILSLVIWKNIHPKNTNSKLARVFEYGILSFSLLMLLSTETYLNNLYFSNFVEDTTSAIPLGVAYIIPLIVIMITTKKNTY